MVEHHGVELPARFAEVQYRKPYRHEIAKFEAAFEFIEGALTLDGAGRENVLSRAFDRKVKRWGRQLNVGEPPGDSAGDRTVVIVEAGKQAEQLNVVEFLASQAFKEIRREGRCSKATGGDSEVHRLRSKMLSLPAWFLD
jgi:hypothetical protein